MNTTAFRTMAAAIGLAGLATLGAALPAAAATATPPGSVITTNPGPGVTILTGNPAEAGGADIFSAIAAERAYQDWLSAQAQWA